MTVVGLIDVVKVSIFGECKSFLLIMCIDAPKSTTNSLSSGLRFDGAGKHQFSEGEKNAALFRSFNFWMLLASLQAASRHIALAIPYLVETDPQVLEHWGYLGRSFQAMDFGLECQHDVRRLLWIEHIGLVSVCLSSSAKSMKTSAAPYPEIRNTVVVYFSAPFFNLAMRIRALFLKSASIFWLVGQALFTEWSGASSFEVILARQSSHFPTLGFFLWDFGFSMLFAHSAASLEKDSAVPFLHAYWFVTETAIVSFRTLPVGLPLPTIS